MCSKLPHWLMVYQHTCEKHVCSKYPPEAVLCHEWQPSHSFELTVQHISC